VDFGGGTDLLTDPDDVPPVPDDPITQPGDLWLLGRHRLLCGDSTKAEDVARLMDGDTADMIFTDPPYGVDYVGKTKDALKIQNDTLGDEGTRELVADALRMAPLKPGGSFYICSPAGNTETAFRLAVMDSGLELRQCIVWVKQQFVMGRQDYHWRHESILYGWHAGAGHYFINDRTQDTVWEIDRPSRSEMHPTMKPVALVEKAIGNSSLPSQVILDMFTGSGTTVIAAEQSGRICYGMELDPRYVDVSIRRWENATGQTATRATTEMAAD
jgi:DNA modification methylase